MLHHFKNRHEEKIPSHISTFRCNTLIISCKDERVKIATQYDALTESM